MSAAIESINLAAVMNGFSKQRKKGRVRIGIAPAIVCLFYLFACGRNRTALPWRLSRLRRGRGEIHGHDFFSLRYGNRMIKEQIQFGAESQSGGLHHAGQLHDEGSTIREKTTLYTRRSRPPAGPGEWGVKRFRPPAMSIF